MDKVRQGEELEVIKPNIESRPGHYLTIKAVYNRRQIDFTSRKLELGDIGQPFLIWSAGTKIAIEYFARGSSSATELPDLTDWSIRLFVSE